MTYKSLWESLDGWAIEELIGYYSNYRKIISPSGKLLPAEHFQLYAISTRYPAKLLSRKIKFQQIYPGVFDLQWVTRTIRLIVLSQIELTEKNAFWLLFSGKANKFLYADQHYHWQHPRERATLNELHMLYHSAGAVMPYTVEDFDRDFTKKRLHLLSPEERLAGLSAEELLKHLPPAERLKGLPTEERLKGLSLETIFDQFSDDEIRAYLAKLQK